MGSAGVLEAEDVDVLGSEEGKDGSELVFGFDDEAAGVESGNGEVAFGAVVGNVEEVGRISFDIGIHHGGVEVFRGKGREIVGWGIIWYERL